MRLTPTVVATMLAGLAVVFAAVRLGGSTPSSDELTFNVQAQTVLNGKPALFFRINDERSLPPLAVYLNAAVRATGGRATSGRIVSAAASAITVALVFVIVTLLTGRMWVAIVAALVLLFSPAHMALSIRGTDALLPATLISAWLYGVLLFLKFDSLRTLAMAAAMLGLAVYAHPAGALTAAFLWMLTIAVAIRRNRVRLAIASGAFAAMWLPAAAWFYFQPDTYPATFGRWLVFAAHVRDPVAGFEAFVNANTLGTRASLYWGFLDPSWLFFTGQQGTPPMLWIALPLIVLALVRWPRHAPPHSRAVVIGSVLMVPLAGATFGVAHYIDDAAAILSLLAILTGVGLDQLVALAVRRRALEDEIPVAPIEGWHAEDAAPRR